MFEDFYMPLENTYFLIFDQFLTVYHYRLAVQSRLVQLLRLSFWKQPSPLLVVHRHEITD